MSLHSDLLTQARHLALNERRHPKQASLRRAISAADYSLFHRLVSDSSLSLLGGARGWRNARNILARCFEHASTAAFFKSYSGGTLPAKVGAFNAPLPITPDLRSVAEAFVDLHEQRHRADYDTSAAFFRADVPRKVDKVADAMAAWDRIRKTDDAAAISLCPLFWKTLKDR